MSDIKHDLNIDKRWQQAEQVMKLALAQGADECAVSISYQRQVGVEIRESKPEKLEEAVQNSLSISLYVDKRYSTHSTNDLRPESLQHLIKEAVVGTRYLTPDPFRSLADPKYYPGSLDMDLDILDPGYPEVTAEYRIDRAKLIEQAILDAGGDDVISATSGYSDTRYHFVRLHSNGFKGDMAATLFDYGVEVTVRDPRGGRPSDHAWAAGRYLHDLPSPELLGQDALDRARAKIGQDKIASGTFDMIVENRVSGKLLSMLLSPMSARALQQKSSWMEDKLGKTVASNLLSVYDEPFIKRGLGSRLFDSEGMAAHKRALIENGQLATYLVDNYYGRKLGMAPNSGSIFNLEFQYGDKNCTEMIADLNKGILITGFLGGNYNATTGDFSFGIVGQWIENGIIVKPVNEMNITGNAQEFWQQLECVGNDPYPYSSRRVPSFMFSNVQFGGL